MVASLVCVGVDVVAAEHYSPPELTADQKVGVETKRSVPDLILVADELSPV